MRVRIGFIALSLICFWTTSSSQIQHPGTPLSDSYALRADVYTLRMSTVDVNALLAEDAADAQRKDVPYRFGYAHMVNHGVMNSGTWETIANGRKVWRLLIESQGAISINLIFNQFFLPTGSSMFVYSEDRSMQIGAFTEKNNLPDRVFSTTPVKGDRIIIEYNQPAEVSMTPELNLSVVVHAYRDIFRLAEEGLDNFGDSGPCHFNVVCPEGASWASQARGAAMVLLSNNTRICSGSLINNVRNDGTPYFLTANHCWDSSQPTWIFMFKYESPTCANPAQEPPTTNTISGSALKAKNADSDFCLLQLSSTPPTSYNVYYPGWNRQDVAATSGAGIHHPSGDIKKISFSNSSYVSDTWSGTPANSHWRVNWSQVSGKTAVTEPGSSGSPIFDQNNRIVGQLHGGPSICSAPSGSLWDAYGKFSMSWDRGTTSSTRLKDWLDPDNTGLTSIDGYPSSQIQVTVNQKLSNGSTQVGTLGRWNGSSFGPRLSAPQTYPFNVGTTEVLHGDTMIYSNEKHRIWKKLFGDEPNVVNHHEFSVSTGFVSTLTSQFKETLSDITVKTDLIDAPGTLGGDVQFKDPWYIDFNDPNYGNKPRNQGHNDAVLYTRTVGATGFKPDYTTQYDGGRTYKGVFLNQDYNIPGNPYYSVGAPNPNPIGGFTSYFLNWDNSNPSQVEFQNANAQQTGVVFKQAGATATAKYKAHLGSSTSQATANPSQRKVIRDDQGNYHMVYCSENHVWYCKSFDGGTSWTPEAVVSDDPDLANKNPSLSFHFAPWQVVVVWEGVSASYHAVFFRSLDVNGVWAAMQTVALDQAYTLAAKPVISTAYRSLNVGEYALVVWYDGISQSLQGRVRHASTGNWSSATTLRSGVFTEFSLNPVVRRPSEPWDLVWVESDGYLNNLYFYPIPVDPTLNPILYPEQITKADPTVEIIRNLSTIRIFNGKPTVAWEHDFWEFNTSTVKYSEKPGGSWTDPLTWMPVFGNYRSPSLTGNRWSFDQAIAWSTGNTIEHVIYTDSWSKVKTLANGFDPSCSVSMGSQPPLSELVLFRETATPVYRMSNATIDYTSDAFAKMDGPTSLDAIAEGRGGVISVRDGTLQFAVVQALLDTMPVQFVPMNDTLRIRNQSEFEARMRTEEFQGSGTLKLHLFYAAEGAAARRAKIQLSVTDGTGREVLATLRNFAGVRDTFFTVTVPLNYASTRLRLGVRLQAVSNSAEFRLERWRLGNAEPGATLAKTTSADSSATAVTMPELYVLRESYPNPFNPSTTIKFDLPENSNVSLVVYDLLGRKVIELANGMKEAGYHSATWNARLRPSGFGGQASEVASGVYFARFTATDANGNVKLSKVNKLLLTK